MQARLMILIAASWLSLSASAAPPDGGTVFRLPPVERLSKPTIVQAQYLSPANGDSEEVLPTPPHQVASPPATSDPNATLGLPELIDLTLRQNPSLAQVGWTVRVARGRALQAGLYPNPTASITGNEISDRTGPGGIWSAYASQEIVTADKLRLSRAAALQEVDQASLAVIQERYRLFTEVRQAYFEALTMQRRIAILKDLVGIADQSVENANQLLKAKEAAELDVVQLEVDSERYRADLEATQRALPAAYQRLAARVGVQELTIDWLAGDLNEPLPEYNLDDVRMYVLGIHPRIRSAEVGVQRSQFLLSRARVQPIPNITVGSGYTYQDQNRSHDWDLGVSVPIPFWDRNQGNILAAQAKVNEAVNQVASVENEIVDQLAFAFSAYASARKRSERYAQAILPRAQQTFELSRRGYQGGQFEYLRVLEAQRSLVEANLELVRSRGEMWQAASEIAGLMLEDQWPLPAAEILPHGQLP